GAAIRNSRLLAESERRRRTAEALAELSRLSSETLDLGTVARRVVESVRTLLGARESALYRLVPETGDLAAPALMGEREQALVLESVQLFDDATRRRHEVDVLAEVVGQINSSLDLAGILARIATGACELTGADGAQIALREPGTDGVRVIHRRGARSAADDALIGLVIQPGKGSGGLVLTTGQPFRTRNYAEDPRITRDYADRVEAVGVVAQIVMPIQDGELKGLLYVFNRTARAFTDRDEA